jgi:hypothetical protein
MNPLIASMMLAVSPLVVTQEQTQPPALAVRVNRDVVEFLYGSQVLGRYQHGPSVAKPFLYPLALPGGPVLTRGWPMVKGLAGESTDHVHQKSAWFCHGDIVPEGVALKQRVKGVEGVDFWSEVPGHGRIVCVEVGEPVVHGPSHVSVVTRNEWRTADGQPILHETRTIHLFVIDGAVLWVIETDLHASVCAITFADTKEGAFGVRVNDQLSNKATRGVLSNSVGKRGEKEVWGKAADWCDYSGKVDGQECGISLFDDPTNRPRAVWHSREYGLMAANPFGRKKSGFPEMQGRDDLVRLAKGDHLKLRYGIYLHPGDAQRGQVADAYKRFSAGNAKILTPQDKQNP